MPQPPAGTEPADLGPILGDMVPKLLTYALSFFVIGLYWLAHWRRFHYIVRADDRLAATNLLLLGFVALIPFPTSLLETYGDQLGAVVVYVLILSAAGIIGPISWVYAYRAGLTYPGLSRSYVRLGALRGLSVPVVLFASIPLALVDVGLAQLSWFLVIPVQWALSRRIRASGE